MRKIREFVRSYPWHWIFVRCCEDVLHHMTCGNRLFVQRIIHMLSQCNEGKYIREHLR